MLEGMGKGKLLLTSGGITNESIQKALVDLLGKPLRESTALFAPTAVYAFPAGSMVVTPGLRFDPDRFKATGVYYEDEFGEGMPSGAGSDKTLPLVDFVVRPYFKSDYFPQATPENVRKWAARVAHPLYALDDESAVKVVDGKVEVVSEGAWRLFEK